MKTLNLPCEIFRSWAGLAIGGAGLFHLFTGVTNATEQLTRALEQTSAARMQLLSWIMLASSLNTHSVEYDLLRILWPLLPIMGAVFCCGALPRTRARGMAGGVHFGLNVGRRPTRPVCSARFVTRLRARFSDASAPGRRNAPTRSQ